MNWDFTRPYRTEEWYNEVKDTDLGMPLCIPSYNRPDAPIFKSIIPKSVGKNNIYVFIRNTEEQFQKYKDVSDMVTLVGLPDWVHDVGMTREAILQWGIQHNFHNLVMVDDRALKLSTMVPSLTRNNKLVLKPAKWSTPLITLKIWEHMQNLYQPSLSYAVFHENSWYPKNIDKQPYISGFTEAICVNLDDCQKYDLHYKNLWEYGMDDFRFLWQALTKGLPAYQFTDIAYKEIPPEKMSQSTGSGADCSQKHTTQMSRKERIEKCLQIFVEKSLGKTWGEPLDGFKYTTLKDGQKELRFLWYKYWQPYYEQHKLK